MKPFFTVPSFVETFINAIFVRTKLEIELVKTCRCGTFLSRLLGVGSQGPSHGEAVLIFLSWVGFMLMGAYLFLGSEALIPQLTANVSAVGGAVTLIRSKSTHGVETGKLYMFSPQELCM